MADLGIWTKNADIQARCPAQVNATNKLTAATDAYVLDVEAYINAATKVNWSDIYAGLDADLKLILKEVGACICAMYVISSDMSGFVGRNGETALDFLHYRIVKGMELLNETAVRKFIGAPSG